MLASAQAELEMGGQSWASHNATVHRLFNLRFKTLTFDTHSPCLSFILCLATCAVSWAPCSDLHVLLHITEERAACHQALACLGPTRVHRLSGNLWPQAQPCPQPESAMTQLGRGLRIPPISTWLS